jgi:hypothetical protein
MQDIDIKGIDKAELLAALVNGARPQGMGFLHAGSSPMTKAEAQEWIDKCRSHDTHSIGAQYLSFDYVKGRPIKSDISGDTFNPRLYDRDQGDGAAARVVASLRAQTGASASENA